jgi:hypothetical protein
MAAEPSEDAAVGATRFSEVEKQRLRDEIRLREEIRQELASAEPTKSPIWAFLNSTFGVALLSGLVLAGVSTWYQFKSAQYQAAAMRRNQLYDRKVELIKSVAEDYRYADYLEIRINYIRTLATPAGWLPPKFPNETLTAEMKVLRESAVKELPELYKMKIEHDPLDSDLILIESLFKTNDVHEAVKGVDPAIYAVGHTPQSPGLDLVEQKGFQILLHLVDTMNREVEQEKQ